MLEVKKVNRFISIQNKAKVLKGVPFLRRRFLFLSTALLEFYPHVRFMQGFNLLSFCGFRAEKVGGSGELWGVQARDAAAHGPPGGRVGDSLGSVSGEVSHSLRTTKFKLYGRLSDHQYFKKPHLRIRFLADTDFIHLFFV